MADPRATNPQAGTDLLTRVFESLVSRINDGEPRLQLERAEMQRGFGGLVVFRPEPARPDLAVVTLRQLPGPTPADASVLCQTSRGPVELEPGTSDAAIEAAVRSVVEQAAGSAAASTARAPAVATAALV